MKQLELVPPDYGTRIDPSTQVRLMPGVDAECHCGKEQCAWPFCGGSEDEE